NLFRFALDERVGGCLFVMLSCGELPQIIAGFPVWRRQAGPKTGDAFFSACPTRFWQGCGLLTLPTSVHHALHPTEYGGTGNGSRHNGCPLSCRCAVVLP